MFARLAALTTRRPWFVVGAWLVVLLLGAGIGTRVFENVAPLEFTEPGEESTVAYERLRELTDQGSQILAVADGVPAGDPGLTASIAEVAAELRDLDGVAEVVDVTSVPPGDPAAAALVATDGEATLVRVTLEGDLPEDRADAVTGEVVERLRSIDAPTVLVGGGELVFEEFTEQAERDLVRGELVAFPIMLVLLVVLFAGFLPAALPLAVAVAGIAGGLLLLYGVSLATTINDYAVNVVTMLGIGLAVDYSLLVVNRFREERVRGLGVPGAIERTLASAGRTVLFSGLTIALCLAGLLALREAWLRAFAWGGVGVALVAMAASTTLLPALLALVGHRFRLRPSEWAEGGFFFRVSRLVQRGAAVIVVVVGAGLVLVAYPFTHAELQNSSWDTLPASSENHRLFTALDERFPGGGTDPVQVVADAPAGPEVAAYLEEAAALPGVRTVASEPQPLAEDVTLIELVPEGGAEGPGARGLVGDLRELDAPFGTQVTGRAAFLVDYRDALLERLPWTLGLMALATLVLLFLLTGSVVIPVKAIVMATLSLGASFGALVWGFQDGHLAGVLGFDPVGYVDVTVPVLMFVFGFGLSMDYEVFMLSRIKETYDETGENDRAVAVGLQRTGRIVTAAAAIITVVFLGLASSGLLVLKAIGFGLALTVVLDATVVRVLMLPATMKLLGRVNWWAPGPLRRLHGRLGLREGPGGSLLRYDQPGLERPNQDGRAREQVATQDERWSRHDV